MISAKSFRLIILLLEFGDWAMGIPFYWDKTKGRAQLHGVKQRSLRLTLAVIATATRLFFILFISYSVFFRSDTRTKDIVQAAVVGMAQFSYILIQITIFFKEKQIVQHINAFLFINNQAGNQKYMQI